MSRYSWGADEHLFVELAEEMSLQANFKAMAIATKLRERRPDGLLDICPANASYQVRFDPDVLEPADLEALLRGVEEEVGDAHGFSLETRVVEVPVLYDDPWTNETLMKFRDRHQEPDSTDLEYAAKINGFSGKDEFIDAHAGRAVVRVDGRLRRRAAVPVPDGPARAAAGGAEVRAPAHGHAGADDRPRRLLRLHLLRPRRRRLPDVRDRPAGDLRPGAGEVFFKAGDIVKFTSITRDEYDDAAASRRGRCGRGDVTFSLVDFEADSDAYNAQLLEVLG